MIKSLPPGYHQPFNKEAVRTMANNQNGHKLLMLITSARQNHLARWMIRQTVLIDPHAKNMVELVFLLGSARPDEDIQE